MAKKLYQESLEMLSKILNNKYLSPCWWSDVRFISSADFSIKTYADEWNICSYWQISILSDWREVILEILLREWKLKISNYDILKKISIKEIHAYLSIIYDECFSYNEETKIEAKRNIREQISKHKRTINAAKKEISKLEKSLLDIDKI